MIRKFTWIAVLLTLACLYALIHDQLKNRVILQSFMDLEHEEALKNLGRVEDAIKRETHHLNKLTGDWAIWDDTYRFAQDGNRHFIESNLQLETLDTESGINLVYILSPEGKPVWGSVHNSETGGLVKLKEFSGESFARLTGILKHDSLRSEKTGLLITDFGPLLLASRPILTSTGRGPSTGVVILGRFLSNRSLKTLVEQTKVDFTVKSVIPGHMTASENSLIARLTREPWLIDAENDRHLNIFGIIPDIYEKPGLLIHVSMERTIMDKGRTAARYVSGSMMITLIFGVVFLVFLVKIYSLDEKRRTARVEALVAQRTRELEQANMETEKARIQAEEASRAKSEFLANMSHEIRTPLNGVIGMTEIAMPTIQNETQREIFETISREAHALLGIINNILDFSKIEARKVDIENIPFDLHLLIGDIGKSQMFLCERKGLIFIVDVSHEVPRDVKGDPGRIRQILMNLCGNALKFTKEGGIVIRCEMTGEADDHIMIKFSVTDTGIGIEKEKQGKIFESFTQVDGSTTRKYGGTGLGITISKQLAELMGGDMGVESEFGKGSTFWFTVRMARHQKMTALKASRPIEALKILVVGGDEREPLAYARFITGLGFSCESAESGKDALTRLKQAGHAVLFNLIIIDFLLSDTDGFTLAAEIRAMETVKHIPIILTTSVGNIGDGRRCEDIGIQGYLSTPIDPVLLKKAIRMVIGENHGLVTRHSIAEAFGDGGRILLVEDYPTNRQVALNLLTLSGFEVDVAENGKEAVECFMERDYALIFMDIQMPVMDGFEATRAIRALEKDEKREKRTPIVAMTANALTRDRENSIEAGMDDFITKPVTRASLTSIVSTWIPDSVIPAPPEPEPAKEKSDGAPYPGDLPLDYDRALSEFMGDREVLISTLRYFLDHCRNQVDTLVCAILEQNGDVVKAESHKIKGGAANLTMDALSQTAAKLEEAGKTGHLDTADVLVARITQELDRLENFLSHEQTR